MENITILESSILRNQTQAKSFLQEKIGLYSATRDLGYRDGTQMTRVGEQLYRSLELFYSVYIETKKELKNKNYPSSGTDNQQDVFQSLYALHLAGAYSLESLITQEKSISGTQKLQGQLFSGDIPVEPKLYTSAKQREELLFYEIFQEMYLKKLKGGYSSATEWKKCTMYFFYWIEEQTEIQAKHTKYDPMMKELSDLSFSIADMHFRLFEKEDKETIVPLLTRDGVKLNDVGGNKEAKELLHSILRQFQYKKYYEQWAVQLPRGILLTGPPGTGKTLLARAFANEIKVDFYEIKCSDIFNKFVGESEKRIKEYLSKPGVLFFDEFDALGRSRENDGEDYANRIVAELLSHMDGITSRQDQIFLAATNNEELIDSAFKRPGRFNYTISLSYPSKEDLEEILSIHMKKRETKASRRLFSLDTAQVAEHLQGCVGADVEEVLNRALTKKAELHVSLIMKNGSSAKVPELPQTEELVAIIKQYRNEKRK
ncbi:MAG TPA: ATP-binding protein [Nanoarchaeota archaeon]|nr:ATP-binding protein [Nanoarchaeota archaeon]HIJ05049.1 ATP-binding protein [Nanoarchaeota archaeon]